MLFLRNSDGRFLINSRSYPRGAISHNKKNIFHSLPRTDFKQTSPHQIEGLSSVGPCRGVLDLGNSIHHGLSIQIFLKTEDNVSIAGKHYKSYMCAIFSNVEGADEVLEELLAFFKVSRALKIDASGAVQQNTNVYFGFALLKREIYTNMMRNREQDFKMKYELFQAFGTNNIVQFFTIFTYMGK